MEAGQRIRDFILEEKIGAGGAGEVWRARHQYLDNAVAIKVIYRHVSQDPHFRERFLDEAGVMARLEHPHIVPVHDFFFLEGVPYLVMSYIRGGSLADLVKRRGRLPLAEALPIARGILAALDFAHHSAHDGVVIHRDVKPSNILVRPDGHAYLVDFGIALVVGKPRHTQFGTNIGTPEYMSPEQIQAKDIDHRTDVYSFGCVLYEMLAGRPPFGSRDAGQSEYEIMSGHVHEPPPSLRDINHEVDARTEAVVFRALAKDPEQRYGGCQELAEALDTKRDPHPYPKYPVLRLKYLVISCLVIVLALTVWLKMRDTSNPQLPLQLIVHKGGSGSGTVTSVPAGMSCGSSCTAPYASGTKVVLQATPDPGAVFSGWSGDAGCAEAVTLTAPLTCTAIFTLDAQAIQQLVAHQQCARVSVVLQGGGVDLGGGVASTSQGADIRKIVESVKGVTQVKEKFEIIPRRLCAVLEILEPIKKQAEDRGIDLVVSLNQAGDIPDYYDGQSLVITGKTPTKFESYVYLDYYSADGTVTHLFPNSFVRTNRLKSNQSLAVGQPNGSSPSFFISAKPAGLELITVIASKTPLFSVLRNNEPAQLYLNDLRQELSKESGQLDVAATFHFIRTNP